MKYFLIILVLMLIAHITNSQACTHHVGNWTASEKLTQYLQSGKPYRISNHKNIAWSACEVVR